MIKKCKPLNCHRFKSQFERFYERVPADVFVVKCPFRNEHNECSNVKETLKVRVIL